MQLEEMTQTLHVQLILMDNMILSLNSLKNYEITLLSLFDTEACDSSPCLNGGNCINSSPGYTLLANLELIVKFMGFSKYIYSYTF